MRHNIAMKYARLFLLGILSACGSTPDKTPSDEDSAAQTANVSERLPDGSVRAGTIERSDALFGGVSAEGREGDIKIYNSKVQFIIQAARESSYYESRGGGLLDADIVRAPGVPGRDVIDEFSVMTGFGLLTEPSEVTVVADGSDGAEAVVRVEGRGTPMTLLTGALETDSIVPAHQVSVQTDFILRPDAYLLEVISTVIWEDETTGVQMGDIIMVGMEAVDMVMPGRGLDEGAESPTGEWVSVMGHASEVSLAVFSDQETFASSGVGTLLSELGPVLAPLYPAISMSDGDTTTFRRYVGVGPDLATLTDAWYAEQGASTQSVGGVVTAGGEPLAGARVHLFDGPSFETVAVTDDQGRWSADVRASEPTAVATGRGLGEWIDLPPGAGWMAPYAHPDVAADVLQTLSTGAEPIAHAEGYGFSATVSATSDTAIDLIPPGTLSVSITDGGPAMVRVDFDGGDPTTADPAIVPGRPSGAAMFGYVRDGSIDIPVEPGAYTITVHRGLRFEPVQESVTITSGETTSVAASLERVVAPEGFLTLDPHSHASPSGDGRVVMAHRLVTMAANGVQVHIGTDHDHVADYRPMLAPLELDTHMRSVVANEASPVLRGHTNVYPVQQTIGPANAGAPRWWESMTDTETWFAQIRAWAGPDAIIQLNHPASGSGMLAAADYNRNDGVVEKPDHFSDDFQAIEVLNDGYYAENLDLYLDLIARGYSVTPTGVSDSHGYRNGVGANLTWLPAGTEVPGDLTDRTLATKMHDGQTIVSRGPFLDVRIDGTWAPGDTFVGSQTLEVNVHAASFVKVDTLVLLENGAEIDRVESGTEGTFELNPDGDAHYVVVASGSEPMQPVYSETPWAMCAAIRIDVDGDGWDAPFPPLGMGN